MVVKKLGVVEKKKGVKELEVVGKSVPMRGAEELVQGKAKFVADMPAELHVKVLGSPHAHAMIKSIDTSAAEMLKGVVAVLTYKDVPKRLMPRANQRALYILDPHLRHVGDEVAAVAATSKVIAEKALELIKVEYEVLPAVFDPEEAAKPDAPKLYPEGNVYGPQYGELEEKGINEPTALAWGDLEKGFAEADIIVEDKFEVKPQVHSALEPYVCLASWEGDELTLWSSTQTPTEVRKGVAYVLGMPESKVRVISKWVGGGFGGKYTNRHQPITALLSKKAGGRRTKLVLTREESLTQAKRFMAKIYVKMGAKKDGTLTAINFKGYADLGGYGNFCGFTAFFGGYPCCAYNCRNVRFEGWDVHTNHFTSQPYRSVQLPASNFATEQVVDQIAEKLGMDPTEIRLKNMTETGDMSPLEPWVANTPEYPRAILESYPSRTIMRKVMEKIDWKRWKGWGKPVDIEGPRRRGLGIVYSGYDGGFSYDSYRSMAASMLPDGSVTVLSSTQSMGQSPSTTLCQLAAESLGLSYEDVSIFTGDTNTGQWDLFGARGSSELTTGGHLLMKAIEKVKQEIRSIAAPKLEANPDDIEVYGKKVYVKGMEERAIPIDELLTQSICASATGPPGSRFPETTPGHKVSNAMVQAAEVEVDMETGAVKVIKVVTGNCPGRMINPGIVRGQYIGGAIQALGYALQEEFNYDEKKSVYTHASYLDLNVPRAMDSPPVDTVIVEEYVERPPHEGTPYGAIGAGELGHWAGPSVVATAIYNAIGIRMKHCPMTVERVLEAIRGGGK